MAVGIDVHSLSPPAPSATLPRPRGKSISRSMSLPRTPSLPPPSPSTPGSSTSSPSLIVTFRRRNMATAVPPRPSPPMGCLPAVPPPPPLHPTSSGETLLRPCEQPLPRPPRSRRRSATAPHNPAGLVPNSPHFSYSHGVSAPSSRRGSGSFTLLSQGRGLAVSAEEAAASSRSGMNPPIVPSAAGVAPIYQFESLSVTSHKGKAPLDRQRAVRPQPQPFTPLQPVTTSTSCASLPVFKIYDMTLHPTGETPLEFYMRARGVASYADVLLACASYSESFYIDVLRAGLEQFDCHGDPLDMALRRFFLEVPLPKEAQQIDRMLENFARRYQVCNPDIFDNPDPPYILATSIMLLHTDHFNKQVKAHMSKADYVRNTAGTVQTMQALEMLEYVYDNVTCSPFVYASAPPKRRGKVDPYALLAGGKYKKLAHDTAQLFTLSSPLHMGVDYSQVDAMRILQSFHEAPTVRTMTQTQAPFSTPGAWGGAAGLDYAPTTPAPLVQSMRITKLDVVHGKEELKRFSRLATKKVKKWGLLLTSAQLIVFKDPAYADVLLRHLAKMKTNPSAGEEIVSGFAPDYLLSLSDAMAYCDDETDQIPHAFKVRHEMSMGRGRTFVIQTSSDADRLDWMARINFCATLRWAGVARIDALTSSEAYALSNLSQSQGSTPSAHSLAAPVRVSDLSSSSGSGSCSRSSSVSSDRDHEAAARFAAKLESTIKTIEASDTALASYLRTARHYSVLTPLLKATRERILTSAGQLASQLDQLYLDTLKADIRRTFLLLPVDVHRPSRSSRSSRSDLSQLRTSFSPRGSDEKDEGHTRASTTSTASSVMPHEPWSHSRKEGGLGSNSSIRTAATSVTGSTWGSGASSPTSEGASLGTRMKKRSLSQRVMAAHFASAPPAPHPAATGSSTSLGLSTGSSSQTARPSPSPSPTPISSRGKFSSLLRRGERKELTPVLPTSSPPASFSTDRRPSTLSSTSGGSGNADVHDVYRQLMSARSTRRRGRK